MEPGNPEATAVAISGKRIVAVGSVAEVKAALGNTKYVVDQAFAGLVVLPGFIDQHLRPFLGALTLSTEVIAPEDDLASELINTRRVNQPLYDRARERFGVRALVDLAALLGRGWSRSCSTASASRSRAPRRMFPIA